MINMFHKNISMRGEANESNSKKCVAEEGLLRKGTGKVYTDEQEGS